MEKGVFRFKRFAVRHERSSMKVGVDAVVLGAWVSHENPGKILDVGTGCGVISLILAQRYPEAKVVAMDIDKASVEEAEENFKNSEWGGRLTVIEAEFPEGIGKIEEKYDLVVSNPPYFKSGIENPTTPREKARHQGKLSVFSLLENAGEMLNPDGKLAVIYPAEFREEVVKYAKEKGWKINRECGIRNNERRPVKRLMMEFGMNLEEEEREELTLFENEKPTQEYRELCKDLYLKF